MLIRSIYENTAYLANDTLMVRSLRIAERLHVGEREPGMGTMNRTTNTTPDSARPNLQDIEAYRSLTLSRLADFIDPVPQREGRRHKRLGRTLSRCFLVPLFTLATAQSVGAQEFVELPRDLEVELALSALPEELQDGAAVYVRDPVQGFVIHREGSNGWMTFVARTSVRFYAADWEYSYPNDMLIPQAHGEVGRAHHMQPYFDIEKLRIAGTPPAEAKRILRQRFADGTYSAPARGGLSYMLAPIHRAYMAPAQSGEIFTVSFPPHCIWAWYA